MRMNHTTRNIILVGPMGAGKTTVGRLLARSLDRPFIDSDHEIEQRAGVNIPLIFEIEGEEGFRRREAAVIAELVEQEGIVLATGGGAVLRAENRTNLRRHGCVIYLHATVDHLLERTARCTHRPLLQTADPRQRLTTLLTEREPLYREVADLIVTTDSRPARQVVRQILNHLQNGQAQRGNG